MYHRIANCVALHCIALQCTKTDHLCLFDLHCASVNCGCQGDMSGATECKVMAGLVVGIGHHLDRKQDKKSGYVCIIHVISHIWFLSVCF